MLKQSFSFEYQCKNSFDSYWNIEEYLHAIQYNSLCLDKNR